MRIISLEPNPAGCGVVGCHAAHYNAKVFMEKGELDSLLDESSETDKNGITHRIEAALSEKLPEGGIVRSEFAIKCPTCDCNEPAFLKGFYAETTVNPRPAN